MELKLGEVGDLCLIPLGLRFAPRQFDYNHSSVFMFRFVYREWFMKPELADNIPILDLKCYEDLDMMLGSPGYGKDLEVPDGTEMNSSGYLIYWKNQGKICCSVDWSDEDSIYEIPGRYQEQAVNELFWKEIEDKEVRMPELGMLGTLLGIRELRHSNNILGDPDYGTEYVSRFNLIWLRGRLPMWVYGEVWKCPEELEELPIYLPSV